MNDHKQRAKAALFRHHQRLLDKDKPKRKHTKVEKIEVEKPCILWMKSMGWEVEESKAEAKWNGRAGRFVKGSLQSGMTDTRGWDSNDRPFYVEFKAPGKLRNIYGSERKGNLNRQSDFIKKQIRRGCFSIAVDSEDMLKTLWTKWTSLMDQQEFEKAKKLLIRALPPEPKRRTKHEKIVPEMGF